MHLILVCLDRNTCQGSIGCNGFWLTDKSVTSRESIMEQLHQIDLAAGLCQHVKVFIMDMNIAIDMRSRNILRQNIVVYKIVSTLRTIFQHGSHGSIRINIGILTLDICISRAGKCKFPVNIYQICFRFSDFGMLCPI